MDKNNNIFVPTVAEFKEDIQTSWNIQEPLEGGIYERGLMVVVRKAVAGSPRVNDRDNVKKQYDNLSSVIGESYGTAPIVTMLPNMPVGDIDFLHNTSLATDHVIGGINFTRNLPIGGHKMISFHLNSLGTVEEFRSKDQDQWREEFHKTISPALKEIKRYANQNDVDVLVETLGLPEFGDMPTGEGESYNGARDLRSLRSPFYIFAGNFVWDAIEAEGLGICLDLCHIRTIYQASLQGNDSIIFPQDAQLLRSSKTRLVNDVTRLNTLPYRNRLVHLNDGAGQYTSQGGTYQEGVTLGKGDINRLPEIIRDLNTHRTPMVLEVNETDFKGRPNTRKSIDYLISQS